MSEGDAHSSDRPDARPEADHQIRLGPRVSLPRAAARFSFMRSRGPGGQAVNKLNTAVQLRVTVTDIVGLSDAQRRRLRAGAGHWLVADTDEIVIRAESHRSQLQNKRETIDRLSRLVLECLPPPKIRRKTKPSRGSVQRRLDEKKRQGQKKQRRNWRDD